MESRRTYLVIEPFGVIAQDLAISIADFDTHAEVRIATSLDDPELHIHASDTVALAIVNADPAVFAQSSLASALVARRAKIVLIGDAAEQANEFAGFPVMHRPYAPESVIALLATLLAEGEHI